MKFINPTPIRSIDLIWWQDAYVTTEGSPENEAGKNTLTLTVGMVVKEDKEFIHVSHFYDGISGELQDPFTTVPKGMVKHRKRIKI